TWTGSHLLEVLLGAVVLMGLERLQPRLIVLHSLCKTRVIPYPDGSVPLALGFRWRRTPYYLCFVELRGIVFDVFCGSFVHRENFPRVVRDQVQRWLWETKITSRAMG